MPFFKMICWTVCFTLLQGSALGSPTGKKVAIIFGGADVLDNAQALEDQQFPETNMFQTDFVSLTQALRRNGWQVSPLFGNDMACSGCASTWDIDPIASAAGILPSEVPKASKANLVRKLDELALSLSSGDELLIEIDTHGGRLIQIGDAALNSVVLSVYDESIKNGNGRMAIDDPDLTKRYKTLQGKGVKLGFGNDSCYGGPAAKRLSAYGCVLTATDAIKVGAGSPVSGSLVDLLTQDGAKLGKILVDAENGVSMEDAYLDVLSKAPVGDNVLDNLTNKPFWPDPFDGLLMPEFSGDLDQYSAAESLGKRQGFLEQFKSNYLEIQNGALVSLAGPTQFGVLEDYLQKSPLTALDSNRYQSIAAYYFHSQPFLNNDPSDVVSANDLASKIQSAGSDLQESMQADAHQYNVLETQEQNTQTEFKAGGFQVTLNLPSDLAPAQESLDQAIAALDGTRFERVAGWFSQRVSVGDKTGSHSYVFFPPTHPIFKTSVNYVAMDLAREMSKTYPAASTPAFQAELAQVIGLAETQAWNSTTPEIQAMLQKVVEGRYQKKAILLEGKKPGPRFVTYILLARIYSYLARHERLGRSNSDVNQCADFNLRQLP